MKPRPAPCPQAGRDPATTSRATAAPKVSFDPPIPRLSLRDHEVLAARP